MASRDLGNDRFVERNDPLHYSFNERIREKKEEKEEKEDSKSENDTIDDVNITAIHICNKSDENIKQDACQISLIHDENLTHRRYVK